MSVGTSAVLVMAYGTPTSPDNVEAYYTDVRRGHAPTPELLAELQHRYSAIGGVSPLAERTRAQVDAVANEIHRTSPETRVYFGAKHSCPSIETTVEQMIEDGITRAVAVVLAPHYSSYSVGQYVGRARSAAGEKLEFAAIDSWHLEETFISLLSARLRTAMALFTDPSRVMTLVTAHSLPARVMATGDPYATQLRETAERIITEAGITAWQIAWQSAGRTTEPWIGPDILEVIKELGTDVRYDGVLVCPAGFVSDHLEILYDIDIEARGVANDVQMQLERTESLNDDAGLMSMLATLALAKMPESR